MKPAPGAVDQNSFTNQLSISAPRFQRQADPSAPFPGKNANNHWSSGDTEMTVGGSYAVGALRIEDGDGIVNFFEEEKCRASTRGSVA